MTTAYERPECYVANNNPYPLCVGANNPVELAENDCLRCCLYEDYGDSSAICAHSALRRQCRICCLETERTTYRIALLAILGLALHDGLDVLVDIAEDALNEFPLDPRHDPHHVRGIEYLEDRAFLRAL